MDTKRIQEGSGVKLVNSLVKGDPFPKASCFRADCPVLVNGERGCRETCFQQHATYIAKCKTCSTNREEALQRGESPDKIPADFIYIGETSRGLYTRHKGHVSKYKSVKNHESEKENTGFMFRHAKEHHGGSKDIEYTIQRTATDKDPMRRIIRESVQITNARSKKEFTLMNGKDEYFGVRVVTPHFIQE